MMITLVMTKIMMMHLQHLYLGPWLRDPNWPNNRPYLPLMRRNSAIWRWWRWWCWWPLSTLMVMLFHGYLFCDNCGDNKGLFMAFSLVFEAWSRNDLVQRKERRGCDVTLGIKWPYKIRVPGNCLMWWWYWWFWWCLHINSRNRKHNNQLYGFRGAVEKVACCSVGSLLDHDEH